MAIAFDAASAGGVTTNSATHTFAHTCTGSLRRLYVVVFASLGTEDGTGAHIGGVTYAGVSMTEINRIREANNATPSNNRWTYLFRLDAPATGANNVVVNSSIGALLVIAGGAVSYTGVKQTGADDNSTTNHANASTSLTCTLTPVAANCWVVMGSKNNAGAPSAGTSTTNRVSSANGHGLHDSNGTVAGSTSLQATQSSAAWAGIMASFEPDTGGGGSTGQVLGGLLVNRGLLRGRLVA